MSARRAAWLGPILGMTLTATLALTGCSRFAGAADGASTPAPPAAATSTSAPATPGVPDAATLGSISSDLESAATANTQADSNVSEGDQAAAQNDNG